MECDFCREMASGHCPALGSGRWIRETKNFVVFPTIGSLTEVWLLITSKQHYRSAGNLPVDQVMELEALMLEIGEYLEATYDKPVIFFEHGPGLKGRGGACIDHVHIHTVVGELELINDLEPYRPRSISSMLEVCQIAQQGMPYLFYQDRLGQRFLATLEQDTPSQFLRQVVARQVGRPDEFDWAVWTEIPTLMATVHRACPYCQEMNQRNFIFDGTSHGDRVLGESDNFFIMPTKGCVVPGYLIIAAKRHVMKVWSSNLAAELEEVMFLVRRVVAERYGVEPIFFEHGSSPRTFPHAHLHAVPLNHSGPPRLNTPHEIIPVSSFQALEKYEGQSVLPWQDRDGRRFLLKIQGHRRPQLLRQVVARELNQPDVWDWRQHPFVINILQTRETLAGKF